MQTKKLIKSIFTLLIAFYGNNFYSQESINSSGSTISSSGGSVSYSVGQVSYTNTDGSNGTINSGVQQVYGISIVNQGILTSITPSTAMEGETIDITVTGQNTNFTQAGGTTLSFSFEQADSTSTIVNSYNIINDSTMEANVTIPIGTPAGTYDVSTSNEIDGDLTLSNSFTVTSTNPQPMLTSITPSEAMEGETIDITVTGQNTNFSQAGGTTINDK